MVNKPTTTLVVGATGNTGKHVVQFLLDDGHNVRVVARSADKMKSLLKQQDYGQQLAVTEASILDLSEAQTQELVKSCDAVVSCLGHNMSFTGMWGRTGRRLVLDSVVKLTKAIEQVQPSCKFILMGSDGVACPGDASPGWGERLVVLLLRHLIPPHADNEEAAAYLNGNNTTAKWSIVRPTNLQDGSATKYDTFANRPGSIFSNDIVTRATVAKFMTDLILDKKTWDQWKLKAPVIHDQTVGSKKED